VSGVLERQAGLAWILLERRIGVDAQGIGQYAVPVRVYTRAVANDSLTRFARGAHLTPEEALLTVVTLWLSGDATLLPDVGDRITTADGLVGTVAGVAEGRTLGDVVDYVKISLEIADVGTFAYFVIGSDVAVSVGAAAGDYRLMDPDGDGTFVLVPTAAAVDGDPELFLLQTTQGVRDIRVF